jgi:ABC-2 type transport system permease protein
MSKIETILRKEWAEVFRNRTVLFTTAFLPLLLTAIPIIILLSTNEANTGLSDVASALPEQFNAFCPNNLASGECFQVYLISQFMMMFMIMPLAIPSSIASYSIVGEKTTRSLEPLLATPISTIELLVGKGLAAVIPGILATFAAFIIFAVTAYFAVVSKATFLALLDVRWLIAIFIAGPLMAILSVAISVMVSSRVNDPRVAEQISALVILPMLAIFFGQIAGLFIINRTTILIASVVLVGIDVVLVWLAARLFQREAILTRWK